MTKVFCRHVYEEVGTDTCPDCGQTSHRLDWKYQNELKRKWLKENPNARYQGWWSI
jgi:hypothetical protein